MTTMTQAARTAPAAGQQALRVTQPRVLLSEWTKFRSLRSTVWTLLTAVVLTIGIGALFSAVSASQYHGFSPADKASFSPISTSLNGMLFVQQKPHGHTYHDLVPHPVPGEAHIHMTEAENGRSA